MPLFMYVNINRSLTEHFASGVIKEADTLIFFFHIFLKVYECRCGLDAPQLVKAGDVSTTMCNIPCDTDRKQFCGGEKHFTVLEVHRGTVYLYLLLVLWDQV